MISLILLLLLYLLILRRACRQQVLSAFEFEQHAGFKSKHPNNHIFLENGKPVYSIIQELKNAPKGILDVVLKDVAGPAINEDSFQAWKGDVGPFLFLNLLQFMS